MLIKKNVPLGLLLAALSSLPIFYSCSTPEPITKDSNSNGVAEMNRPPQIGDDITISKFDADGIEVGPEGENVTWDFSVLPDSMEPMNLVVESPNQSAYKSSFPDADFVVRNNFYGSRGLSETDQNHHFFKIENNQLVKLGRTDVFSANNVLVNTFDDAEVQLTYPLKFGVNSSDNFSGSFVSSGINFVWKGNDSYTVDGTGKLVLQGRTLENVVRLKRTRNYRSESSLINNDWDFVTYEWYIEGVPFPVLVIHNVTLNNSQSIHEGYVMHSSEF